MKKEVCEMSRKPFIAGNWKMNKNPEEAKAFVEAVASKLPSADLVEAGLFYYKKDEKPLAF